MPELTQLERSLRILQRLSTHEQVTVQELYRLFDGRESIRTIQRTLDSIQTAHIPLAYTTGPHGVRYYSLHRAFDYIPLTLTPDEILAAMLLAQFGDLFQGTRVGQDIQGVFEKLDQLVPPGSVAITSALSGISDLLHVQQPGMVNVKEREAAIKEAFRAIIERRVCHIAYRRPGAPKVNRFDLHPYSLVFHSGLIYLVGFQPYHKDWIYLALQRIQSVDASDVVFDRDPVFNIHDFLKDNFGIWREEPVDVVIRFDATVAPSIRERRWHPSQQVRELEGGGVELKMRVGPSQELVAWILRWGAFAEVMEPEELRKQMGILFAEGLKKYAGEF